MVRGSMDDPTDGRTERSAWRRLNGMAARLALLGVAGLAVASVAVFGSASAPAGDGAHHGVSLLGGSAPVISGTAHEGQTLTAGKTGFSRRPAAILNKWVRCDATGAECRAIPHAKSLSYRLTAADVGSRVRFEDLRLTAFGYGIPAVSAATALVTESRSPGSPAAPAASQPGASSYESARFSEVIAAWNLRKRISSSLLRQLPMRGRTGASARLLREGGASVTFKALTGGSLSLRYSIPPGEYESKPGPLILTGHATYPRAGTQTVKLELTAAGRQILKTNRRVNLFAAANFTTTGHLDSTVSATIL